MDKRTTLTATCGLILLTAGVCLAQNEGAKPAPKPGEYFHLDFVLKELEGGKVVNARHYSTTAATGEGAFADRPTIRTGSKVPVTTGKSGAEGTQLTYIDVGVNIDCHSVHELEGNLALNVAAEITSAATSTNPPLIRQTKWGSSVIVPIGKPTMLFSSDGVADKSQMQLELTATPVR